MGIGKLGEASYLKGGMGLGERTKVSCPYAWLMPSDFFLCSSHGAGGLAAL